MIQTGTSRPGYQKGVAVLIMFAILFMAGANLFISFASNNVVSIQRADQSGLALREAKAALIGYAMMHGDYFGPAGAGPGHLPCPDTNNDGAEDAPCGNNALGRLPQSITVALPAPGSTLQLSDYNYGVDEELWYGLTNAARRSPATAFNTTTVSTHTLDGQVNFAAVLIAPGSALVGQSRPNNNRANYLEGGNAAGNSFVSNDGTGPDSFNDRVLGITIEEIMLPVTARVAETIKGELDAFHTANGRYPDEVGFPGEYATAIGSAPLWFANNNWDTVSQYSQVTNDSADITFTGCLGVTYTLDNAAGTIARTGTGC